MTIDTHTSPDVVAHHEAGHAVAATMRGGSVLHSVDLTATSDRDGITWHGAKVFDIPFIAYAGPWAEARHQWGKIPVDGEDDDGLVFADYISGVFFAGGSSDFHAVYTETEWSVPNEYQRVLEAAWMAELEREWPAVQTVARHLLNGVKVTDESVRKIRKRWVNGG